MIFFRAMEMCVTPLSVYSTAWARLLLLKSTRLTSAPVLYTRDARTNGTALTQHAADDHQRRARLRQSRPARGTRGLRTLHQRQPGPHTCRAAQSAILVLLHPGRNGRVKSIIVVLHSRRVQVIAERRGAPRLHVRDEFIREGRRRRRSRRGHGFSAAL